MNNPVIIGNATLYLGDAMTVLATLPDCSVNCCVTSPPYWGLRDYGTAGQLGLESTTAEYVEKMVAVFREVRRVLRDDGTLWLNLGDSYFSTSKGSGGPSDKQERNAGSWYEPRKFAAPGDGIKTKDLVGIPWRVAFALQADGWYLRQDIIWSKPNPMPESVTDRCTKAHEYIFLLAKSERYYFDAKAIQEPFSDASIARLEQPNLEQQAGSDRVPGKTNGAMKACGPSSYRGSTFTRGKTGAVKPTVGQGERVEAAGRNKRSVWTVTTQPYKEAHFATFPPKLIEPCILAGAPAGGVILDPFNGSGTTGLVALQHGRAYIGIELNPDYLAMTMPRIENAQRQERLLY